MLGVEVNTVFSGTALAPVKFKLLLPSLSSLTVKCPCLRWFVVALFVVYDQSQPVCPSVRESDKRRALLPIETSVQLSERINDPGVRAWNLPQWLT